MRRFALDESSGGAQVVVRNTVDLETTASYDLHVLAIDDGEPALTGTATLSVTLLDINDNAPDLADGEDNFVVPANPGVGFEVARIRGTDLDTDVNGAPFTMTWQCNDASCADFTFSIDTGTQC